MSRTLDAPTDGRLTAHLDALEETILSLREYIPTLRAWGHHLARRLPAGARLLVAGNGGSAAEAQHLTAELVGRFVDDRPAFSAIALHAETSSATAISNDYGYDMVFARQVEAHGRTDDVVMLLSTSGRSANMLEAAAAARRVGASTWALTGANPNPLADAVDDAVCLTGPTASVQEAHLVAVHVLCTAFEAALPVAGNGHRRSP